MFLQINPLDKFRNRKQTMQHWKHYNLSIYEHVSHVDFVSQILKSHLFSLILVNKRNRDKPTEALYEQAMKAFPLHSGLIKFYVRKFAQGKTFHHLATHSKYGLKTTANRQSLFISTNLACI